VRCEWEIFHWKSFWNLIYISQSCDETSIVMLFETQCIHSLSSIPYDHLSTVLQSAQLQLHRTFYHLSVVWLMSVHLTSRPSHKRSLWMCWSDRVAMSLSVGSSERENVVNENWTTWSRRSVTEIPDGGRTSWTRLDVCISLLVLFHCVLDYLTYFS